MFFGEFNKASAAAKRGGKAKKATTNKDSDAPLDIDEPKTEDNKSEKASQLLESEKTSGNIYTACLFTDVLQAQFVGCKQMEGTLTKFAVVDPAVRRCLGKLGNMQETLGEDELLRGGPRMQQLYHDIITTGGIQFDGEDRIYTPEGISDMREVCFSFAARIILLLS